MRRSRLFQAASLLAAGSASASAQDAPAAREAAPDSGRTSQETDAGEATAAAPAAGVVRARAVRDSLVARARAQIGRRYRWGGTSPEGGFDCSGLVRYVMSALRVPLPRTARDQAASGRPVAADAEQLRPGDLVTFGSADKVSHIGIYVGDGRFVHASTKAGRVIESSLSRRQSALIRKWQGARRFVFTGDTITVRPSL